jgi:hypothetical protein
MKFVASSIRSAPSCWSAASRCGKGCVSYGPSFRASLRREPTRSRPACCASSRTCRRTGAAWTRALRTSPARSKPRRSNISPPVRPFCRMTPGSAGMSCPSSWGGASALQRSGGNPGGSSTFLLLDDVGLHVDGRRLEPRGHGTGSAARRCWGALAAEHALQEGGGLDKLARTREARSLGNYVLISIAFTLFCRRGRP